MKKIKYLIILVLFLSLLPLVGCNREVEKEEEKEVFDVVEVAESYNKSYEYDEFKLEYLKIRLVYVDGSTKDIPVTSDMVNEKDLAKLTKAGSPRIVITYKDEFQLTYIVNLIDSSDLDKNLNKDGKYDAVIKAIRNNDTINFILEPNRSVAALSFAYSYDKSIMQLNNAKVNEALGGIGNIRIDDKKGQISFAYSEKDSQIEAETILFSVKYTGDFRTSNLKVDDTFTNVVFSYNSLLENTEQLNNILYHASIK